MRTSTLQDLQDALQKALLQDGHLVLIVRVCASEWGSDGCSDLLSYAHGLGIDSPCGNNSPGPSDSD